MNISKIKIKGQIYNIVDANAYVAEVNGERYASLNEAVVACGTTPSTITLVGNEVMSDQVVIGDGQNITLNLNGKSLTAKPNWNFNSGLLAIHHGGTLTINGEGEIFGVSPGGCVYCGIVLTVDKTDNDSSKPARLIINGGHIVGQCYGISGNGSDASRGNTECIINGGLIEASSIIAGEDNCGYYQPQFNSKMIFNDGVIRGRSAIEIRSGDFTMNGGIAEAYGFANECMIKNNNGPTSKGVAVAIAQHTTKQPINVIINNGQLIAECPFFEGNPMGNDELSIATVKAEINGGSFRIIGNGIESFHAADLTEFVKGGEFIHEFTYKKYLDPEKFDVDNWPSI